MNNEEENTIADTKRDSEKTKMGIDQALSLLETFVESDIRQLSPKDRLNFWQQLEEFRRAKIQRIPFEPETDDQEEVSFKYVRDTDNKDI